MKTVPIDCALWVYALTLAAWPLRYFIDDETLTDIASHSSKEIQ